MPLPVYLYTVSVFGRDSESSTVVPQMPARGAFYERLSRNRGELALLAGSVTFMLLALAGLEAFARARAASADPNRESINEQNVYSEAYGWRPSPGAWVEDGGRRVTVNRWGFRGAEVPLARSTGRPRVLILGDSIAFGLDVDDEQTFAGLLSQKHIEALNLAVQGFGPGQSLLRLEGEGLRWQPDLVVMALCLDNDFADVMLAQFLYDGEHPKPFFRIQNDSLVLHDGHLQLSLRRRLGVSLAANSAAARWLLGPVLAPATRAKHWKERRRDVLRKPRYARQLTTRLLARMREDVAERGARLLVLLFPGEDSWKPSVWSRSLLEAPQLAGAEVVEMAAEYRRRGLTYDDVAFDSVGHLTPLGHRVTAELIADRLSP